MKRYQVYILPILSILLSLIVMQLFCSGAENKIALYDFSPVIKSELKYEFIAQEKILSYDLSPREIIKPAYPSRSYFTTVRSKSNSGGLFKRK